MKIPNHLSILFIISVICLQPLYPCEAQENSITAQYSSQYFLYLDEMSSKYRHIPGIKNLLGKLLAQLVIEVGETVERTDASGNVLRQREYLYKQIAGEIKSIHYDSKTRIAHVLMQAPVYTMIISQKWEYSKEGWIPYNPEK